MGFFIKQTEAGFERIPADSAGSVFSADFEADYYIESLEEYRSRLQESRNMKKMNENLIRIMRERANQKRGIHPKKKHDGYIVLSSSQWTERYGVDVWDEDIDPGKYQSDEKRQYALGNGLLRIEQRTAECWKTVIQTPYDAGLPIEVVLEQIEKDLFVNGIILDLGCVEYVPVDQNGEYQDFGGKNGVYRWRYRADFRTGLWNIEIYTTKSISVTDNRR